MLDALGDLNRLQHALAFGEPAEKQQVVVGLFAEGERVGIDAVQHRADHIEAVHQLPLLARDRDERRLRILRPQPESRSGQGEWCSVCRIGVGESRENASDIG